MVMSSERTTPGVPADASAPPVADADDGADAVSPAISPALRLQILATEHWSLLASRSLAWNEAFARAGMLLASLSGAIVALALVGQGSGFGSTFVLFGVAILPVVLFIGLTTFVRLGAANYHDAQCVIGMNRIRAAYLAMAPELEPVFVMGHHDDPRGVAMTMAVEPGVSPLLHLLSATPSVVSVVDAAIAAALAGLVAWQAWGSSLPAVVAAVAAFVLVFAGHVAYAQRRVRSLRAAIQPMFPSPPEASRDPAGPIPI
jgi:hypothetical protein